MSGVPSRLTNFIPWPGKMLNSLNAHLSVLTTILRGAGTRRHRRPVYARAPLSRQISQPLVVRAPADGAPRTRGHARGSRG